MTKEKKVDEVAKAKEEAEKAEQARLAEEKEKAEADKLAAAEEENRLKEEAEAKQEEEKAKKKKSKTKSVVWIVGVKYKGTPYNAGTKADVLSSDLDELIASKVIRVEE